MKMQVQGTLIGVKKNDFSGKIDGEQITSDTTSFFIIQDLPSSNGKARGQASQEFKFGKADEFEKWTKVPLPCNVDAEFSVETTGKNVSRMNLTAITPSAKQPSRAGQSQ